MNIFTKNIRIYSNMGLFGQDSREYFYQKQSSLGNNETSNIFALIDIGRMNIQIHWSA